MKDKNLIWRGLLCACVSVALTGNSSLAQGSIYNAYNDTATKFYEDKEYGKAERLLVDAVKEAEKLPANGDRLLTSLRLLRKVYLAMGKSSQASQVEQRMLSLGDATTGDTSGGNSPTEEPPPSSRSDQSADEGAAGPQSRDAKGMRRDDTPDPTKKNMDFAISTNSSREPEQTSDEVKEDEAPTQIASSSGLSIGIDGLKKAVEVMKLNGHAGWSKTCDISSDGLRAISGSTDNTIRYWNLKTGKEIGTFEGHDDDVNCVVISPPGNNAASGGSDKTVRLWDLDSGMELKKFEGHENIVTCVAFDYGGSRIASAGYDGTVRVWDTMTGKEVKRLTNGKLGTVRCLAFTADGDQLVSGGSDKIVSLWNLRDGTLTRQFIGHKGEISSLTVSKDGSKVLSASRDLTVRLWDIESGEPIKCLNGHTNWVVRAEFLPDDQVISGSLDKTIRVWDLNRAKELDTYKLQSFGMWSLAFTNQGDKCLTGSDDFTLRLWKLRP